MARAELDKQPGRRTADVRRGRPALRRHQRRPLAGPGPALAARRDRGGRPAAGRAGARPRRRHRHVEPAVRRPRRDRRPVRLLARHAAGRQAGPAARCRSPPATAPGCRSPTPPSTRSRSPSGCATSSTRWPGLREMRRVTRPGGRLVVCEFSHPTWAPFRTVYVEYLMRALPPIARAVSSSPDAYVYLAESIRAWPDQPGLAALDRRGRLAARPSGATSPAASSPCTAPASARTSARASRAIIGPSRQRRRITQRLRALNPQVSPRNRARDSTRGVRARSGVADCVAAPLSDSFTKSQTATFGVGRASGTGRNAGMELYMPVLALALLAAGFAVGSVVMSAVVGPASATTGPSWTPTSAASSPRRSRSAAAGSR